MLLIFRVLARPTCRLDIMETVREVLFFRLRMRMGSTNSRNNVSGPISQLLRLLCPL